jgi:hypothetical protein
MEDEEEDPLKSRAAMEQRSSSAQQSVGGVGSLGASPVPPFASPTPTMEEK